MKTRPTTSRFAGRYIHACIFPRDLVDFPSAERLGVVVGEQFYSILHKKHWEWILETLRDALTSYDILDFATSALKQ